MQVMNLKIMLLNNSLDQCISLGSFHQTAKV